MPVDGVPDAEPGTDSAVLTNTVLFKAGGEIGVIVEVMNVLGKFVALVSVELTKVLISMVCGAVMAKMVMETYLTQPQFGSD